MRFIENGINIPDELLLALDEGRVVFVCGAGVSCAKAGLPGFFDLVDKVMKTLCDPDDLPAAKIMATAMTLIEACKKDLRIDVPGLISADRVFGLLVRDFFERDIECAVAEALKPDKGVDLEAHELLLDLATTRDGVTKLVTTNFDRLFDDCGRELKTWQPPRLPEPARPGDMNGIVYLHGRATEDYDGAEGDGFTLSSAEFGRAYLADGWAARFFKDVIDRYTVVFVGYSADDPPVQYLLEGLSKSNGRLGETYAFQGGDADYAASRWKPKGVAAIPYDVKDGHAALWDTLKEWAERAKDPEGWQEKIIEMARRGPETLSPFKREQVAHLISTKEGARKFRESDPPAPATWLCVFDHSIRCSDPDQDENGSEVNPFALYGLASDVASAPIHPDNRSVKPETPNRAWDAFALNRRDQLELRDEHVTPLRGGISLVAGCLPDRINCLGSWISKVSEQSAAVWWGVRQSGLHKDIQKQIRGHLELSDTECAPHILQSWHYLFEHWRAERDNDRLDWYDFAAGLKISGWDKNSIRKYEELSRPRLKVHERFRKVVPPQANEVTTLGDLLRLKLTYNENRVKILIPDEWLAEVVSVLKRNLDIGVALETERGRTSWMNLPQIIPSIDPDISVHTRYKDLSGAAVFYAFLLEKLLNFDAGKARQEVATWPTGDNKLFARLRIWASRFEGLIPTEEFDEFFGKVSRKAFWNQRYQSDLLHTLKERWAKLPMATTRRLEERILEGPEPRNNEAEPDLVQSHAGDIATRLYWLHSEGCKLNVNYEDEIKRLQIAAPYWTPEHANNADRSNKNPRGNVPADTEYSFLLLEPLPEVLAKVQELSGRTGLELIINGPFARLSTHYPVRALSVLRLGAKRGEYPEWAWRGFLHSQKRKDDEFRFKNFIAELLISMSDETLKSVIAPVSDWFLSATDGLSKECVPVFERMATRLLGFLNDNPDAGNSGAMHNNYGPDWATEALNSPAGKIAQALINDPRHNDLATKQGLPAEWRTLAEVSLALSEDNGRFALVFYCYHLNRFHDIDPEWTEEKLLSVLKKNDAGTLDAWWSGYLWSDDEPPGIELFQTFKPYLLEKVASQVFEEGNDCDRLASLALTGWGYSDAETGAGQISNNEFRKILLESGHIFRSRILLELKLRSKRDSEDGEFWKSLRERFLRQVWPRQRVAKTPHDSARLIEFAFSDEECFIAIADAIIPLIDKIERDTFIRLPPIGTGGWSIVDNHPERILKFLNLALPESANNWPYGINDTLEHIVFADPLIRKNKIWIELNRRWDSR